MENGIEDDGGKLLFAMWDVVNESFLICCKIWNMQD